MENLSAQSGAADFSPARPGDDFQSQKVAVKITLLEVFKVV